jgi:hypothetical protein
MFVGMAKSLIVSLILIALTGFDVKWQLKLLQLLMFTQQ